MPNWLETITLSAATLIVGHFIWDALWKPSLETRDIANTLLIEVGQLHKYLLIALEKINREVNGPPGGLIIATPVYSAVGTRIGQLPRKVAEDVLVFYNLIEQINNQGVRDGKALFEFANAPRPLTPRARLEHERILRTMRGQVAIATQSSNTLRYRLHKLGNPWWSPRSWFGEKVREYSPADIGQMIDNTDSLYDRVTEIERIKAMTHNPTKIFNPETGEFAIGWGPPGSLPRMFVSASDSGKRFHILQFAATGGQLEFLDSFSTREEGQLAALSHLAKRAGVTTLIANEEFNWTPLEGGVRAVTSIGTYLVRKAPLQAETTDREKEPS